MRKLATRLLALALVAGFASLAGATQYPPGPGGACPDSLTIFQTQNLAAACHPATLDTVRGVGGIITGFDNFPTGFAFYMQTSGGAPWTGIDVFTGSTNKQAQLGLQLGDSVVVYGKMQEFQGETEIEGLDGSQSTDDCIVRKVSSGHAVPNFHVGTISELQELPTNPNAEQWEGMLVKVRGPLRVVRTNVSGGNLGFRWMICVNDNACPIGTPAIPGCDSLFVDLATLANPAINPPAIGAIVDSVQGIYNQRTRGYRIQIRDGNDMFDLGPTTAADAYSIEDNLVRVVFTHNLNEASAEDISNYSLSSFGTVNSATLVSPSIVVLDVSNGLSDGDLEGVTINGVIRASNGVAMTSAASHSFYNGVMTMANLQAPDPAFLPLFQDRTRYGGTGSAAGLSLTVRGVCTAKYGGLYYLQDENGALRGGAAVFAPIAPLVLGRRYLVSGAVQEFNNETEVVNTVYIVDEGNGTIPSAIQQTVAVLRDTTTDMSQSNLTGEDYEGMLVKLYYAKVQDNSPVPGGFFDVLGNPAYTDSINVDDDGDYTYQAVQNDVLTITGVLGYPFGQYRVLPRTNADILFHGNNVGVGPVPTELSFAVFPNPSRTQRVSFGLPRESAVELSVFDTQGREIALLAKGTFVAGTHSREWNGLTRSGAMAGAGVYFLRLKVGDEVRSLRAVRLQ